MRALWLLLPLLLASCMHRIPKEDNVQRPIHDLVPAPDRFTEQVVIPIWPTQHDQILERMIDDGWWLVRSVQAEEPGTFVDDKVKGKVLLVFQRYNPDGE